MKASLFNEHLALISQATFLRRAIAVRRSLRTCSSIKTLVHLRAVAAARRQQRQQNANLCPTCNERIEGSAYTRNQHFEECAARQLPPRHLLGDALDPMELEQDSGDELLDSFGIALPGGVTHRRKAIT